MFKIQKYSSDSHKVQQSPKKVQSLKKNKSNGGASACDFISWNESKYNSQSIDQFLDEKAKEEEKKNKLIKPIGKSAQKPVSKNINNGEMHSLKHQRNHKSDHYSIASNTLYSVEDNDDTVNYRQHIIHSKSKSRRSRDARKSARKNTLPSKLLDKSIDNTISMIERSKKNNLNELELSDSSRLKAQPKYKFQLKNNEREMYLHSFRKMQDLKVTNEENWY